MFWIIVATLLFQTATEADIETGTVVIDVVGLESSEGQVVVALLSPDEWEFPPNPNRAEICLSSDISNLAAHLEVSNVPAGKYVAMTFHDENANGQIDEDEEMIGFSGTSQQQQPPTFENMCFEHSGNISTVRLIVRAREQLRNGPGGGPGGGGPGGGGPGGGMGGGSF